LISALKDRDSPARGDAAWALGKIRDPRAVEPLIAALKDENPSIQEDAEKALMQITGKDFGPDPVKWQNWWKQNKGNVGSGG
jgi:HEAT repeat protein